MHPFVVFHFYILYSLDNKGPDSIFTYKMYSACRFHLVIRIRVPANVSTCLLEIVVLGSKTNISDAVGNAFGINRHATNKEGIIGQGFENVLFHILSIIYSRIFFAIKSMLIIKFLSFYIFNLEQYDG